jgi:peptidoglycan/xylan/chitin deacetylase (PgdA/CDA1 family)
MHRYFIRTPWLVKKIFSRYIWNFPPAERAVYLTFDDGPHPDITPWVLNLLNRYQAKATFFCIGDNVRKYPETYRRILEEGHAVGNHTHNHLNGWKTDPEAYIKNIIQASGYIRSNLFRPPYGRLRSAQARQLAAALETEKAAVIMWDVLSGDFDRNYTPDQCFRHVADHVQPGSVVVFHDSGKAWPNLQVILPKLLPVLRDRGYMLKKIEL